MAHFLLYLPGAKGQSAKMFGEIGLPDLAAGAEFMESQGPDGGRGALVAWRKPAADDKRFHFARDLQTWIPAVPAGELAAGRYWVGVWKDSLPKPAELARGENGTVPHTGHSLQLGDGQCWIFPDARELPRDFVFDGAGELTMVIQPAFQPLREEALQWLDRLVEGAAVDGRKTVLSYSELFAFLLKGLRLNYRIVPEVVTALALLNTGNVQSPLFAMIGALSAGAGLE
jgi:hypothetical protein